jgi:acyl-CoA thioesterase FadM
VAATLIPISIEGFKTDPHVVQKIVRYKKHAVPRDRLIAEVRPNGRRGRFIMFTAGIINQNNEVVAEYERIIGAV